MVWVRERTILTERPPLVGEEMAKHGAHNTILNFVPTSGSAVADALCYKPEGRWFEIRRLSELFLQFTNPSSHSTSWD
jgi:hypothetical protein